MTDHYHAVIWMDHAQAKIFRFNATDVEPLKIHTHLTGRHAQHKANTTGSGHKAPDREFYGEIIAAVEHSGAILLAGPGTGKVEFKHYLGEHAPKIDARISAVETLDHPTDGELLALARKFFKVDDRMHAQGD